MRIVPAGALEARQVARVWSWAVGAGDGRVPAAVSDDDVNCMRTLLDDPSACAALAFSHNLAESGEVIPAGFYLFTQSRSDRGAGDPLTGRAHLVRLAVDPSLWGRGIGTALLDHAVGAARALGFDWLDLSVRESNIRARRLYEKAGWTPTSDHYHDPGDGGVEIGQPR